MSPRNPQPDCKQEMVASAAISVGLPAWITPELIRATMEVWQPFYPEVLTEEDAVTIIQSVGSLFRALSSGAS